MMFRVFLVLAVIFPVFAELACVDEYCKCKGDQLLDVFCDCNNNVLSRWPKMPINTWRLTIENCIIKSELPTTYFRFLYKLESLRISRTTLGKIPSNTFVNNPLVKVQLVSNKLNHINPGTFSNLNTLKHLDLTGNQLSSIQTGLFPSSLATLYLSRNYISRIANGSFGSLPNLNYLDLSENGDLPASEMPNMFSKLNREQELNINLNGINSFEGPSDSLLMASYFRGLDNLNLNLLSLQESSITYFEPRILKHMRNTKCFSLANNKIGGLAYQKLPEMVNNLRFANKLYYIDSSGQVDTLFKPKAFTVVEKRCKQSFEDIETLTCPRLSNEQIIQYGYDAFNFPKTLRHFHIDNIPFEASLGKIALFENNVTKFSARNLPIFTLKGPIIGLTCLQEIDISGSRLMIRNETSLQYFWSLKKLNMSGCQIGSQMSSERDSLIRKMDKLQVLDLSDNDIRTIDLSYLSDSAPSLTHLYLGHNKLTIVPDIVSKTLTYLDLSSNKIESFGKVCVENLERLNSETQGKIAIDMQDNKFTCLCDLKTYRWIKWFQNTDIQFFNKSSYICSSQADRNKKMRIDDMNVFVMWLKCNSVALIATSSSLFGMLATILIVGYIHRKRWIIQFTFLKVKDDIRQLFKSRNRTDAELLINNEDEDSEIRHPYMDRLLGRPQDVEFIYILFCRSEQNRQIAEDIGTHINNFSSFHILYQERSFVANLPDDINIYHCVRGSKRCIVLLTNDFFDDQLAVQALYVTLGRCFPYHITVGVPPLPLQSLFGREFESFRGLLHRPNVVEYPNDVAGRTVAKQQILAAAISK